MISKLKFLKNNRLAQNSFIVFVGSFVGGIGNYIYNMLMGRMLSPSDFGVLASLISLFYIISVFSGTLSLTISRSIAEFRAHNKLQEAKFFINKINKWLLVFGAMVFVAFMLFSPIISDFLRISSVFPVIVLGAVFGMSLIGSANNAGLQGLQRFTRLSFSGILGAILKIVFGVFFVWLGWGAGGALGSLVAGGIFTILYAYYSLGLPKKAKKIKLDMSSMLSFAKPVFFSTLCITALYNIDVILVKHFFDSTTAGHYGVLSLLGKIVFFITGSVAAVLFPTIVDRHSRNEDYSLVLKYSVFLVILGSSAITAFYFIFPKAIVGILFGSPYLSIVPYLGSFGIVMALFSLINLIVVYNLSIKRIGFVPILIFGLITEIGLIYFYHNDIWQIVHSMLFSMSIILSFLLLFHYSSKSGKIKSL